MGVDFQKRRFVFFPAKSNFCGNLFVNYHYEVLTAHCGMRCSSCQEVLPCFPRLAKTVEERW